MKLYKIKIKWNLAEGTLPPWCDTIMDRAGYPWEGTRREAKKIIKDLKRGQYRFSHGELKRPKYKIIPAR